jgi:hypothetical protein
MDSAKAGFSDRGRMRFHKILCQTIIDLQYKVNIRAVRKKQQNALFFVPVSFGGFRVCYGCQYHSVRGNKDKEQQFPLTFIYDFIREMRSVQVPERGLIGNPVKIGDGPAAVIGDESCKMPLCR